MDITDDPVQTTRDLLDRRATVRHGFLDVLGESVCPARTGCLTSPAARAISPVS